MVFVFVRVDPQNKRLILNVGCRSCDRRADGSEVFQLGGYKAPAKSVWLGFEKYPSCFHLQKLLLKSNKQTRLCVCIQFWKSKKCIWEMTGKKKSMGLQWDCCCRHVGLLWTAVANTCCGRGLSLAENLNFGGMRGVSGLLISTCLCPQ